MEPFKEGVETVSLRGSNLRRVGVESDWAEGSGWADFGPKPMDHRSAIRYIGKGRNGLPYWAGLGPQMKTSACQKWARVKGKETGHGLGGSLPPEPSS